MTGVAREGGLCAGACPRTASTDAILEWERNGLASVVDALERASVRRPSIVLIERDIAVACGGLDDSVWRMWRARAGSVLVYVRDQLRRTRCSNGRQRNGFVSVVDQHRTAPRPPSRPAMHHIVTIAASWRSYRLYVVAAAPEHSPTLDVCPRRASVAQRATRTQRRQTQAVS